MIIKSTNITTSSGSSKISHHLTGKVDENDFVNVLWGSRADVDDSFTNAELSNRKYGVKNFMVSNLEEMSDEQFLQTIDSIGQEFGFTRDNIKLAVIHGKDHHHGDGRHAHFLVETINPENGRNFDFKNYQQRQELVSRKMELDNGFQLNKGRHNRYVFSRLEQENPEYAERMKHLTEGRLERKTISEKRIENLRRRGSNPFQMKKELKEVWTNVEGNFDEFAEKIKDSGYSIEQGRKTLIINDKDGKFVTGIKNVLNVNDKELTTILQTSKYAQNNVASHGFEGPQDASSPLAGIATATPGTPSDKPENQPAEPSRQPTQKAQPETSASGHIVADLAVDSSQSTGAMSQDEKASIQSQNSDKMQARQTMKENLAGQERMAKALEELLKQQEQQNQKKPAKTWNNVLDDEERKLIDIINQPHPKLKIITDKQVKNWIYKNYSDDLKTIKNRKEKIWKLRYEIKELRQGDRWWNNKGKKADHKKTEEQEKEEKLQLMIIHIVHAIMYKLGLTNVQPNPWNSLTKKEKKDYLIIYKTNEYAQLLCEQKTDTNAINRISLLKMTENNEKIREFQERPEVQDSRKLLMKLNNLRQVDINDLDEIGQNEFKDAMKNMNIDGAMQAVRQSEKRQELAEIGQFQPVQPEYSGNVIKFKQKKKVKNYSRSL
ncbi:relaxase/mobilization nuclease domain-containing protein [Zymomonas mobilis]|uniref:relaxase/mobilization nuclease domain-containing protein n=1 Tax=Zymomonas mobilis TaxID=542 RepID=UPI0039E9A742